ncbi:hypothetical protein NCF86_00115 [Pelagerythrobacter marinus]|nr:hypothetical protein NCF86_00115 [Pelagerythrobacter marinus]
MTSDNTPSVETHDFYDALDLYLEADLALALQPEAKTDDAQRKVDRLVESLCAAEAAVFEQPAPDLRAVLAKLEVAGAEGRFVKSAEIECIRRDLLRVGRFNQSPTFLPAKWLTLFKRAGGTVALTERDGTVKPVTGCPLDSHVAVQMLRDLTPQERDALRAYLLCELDPADYGLEAA